jgi:hypothetical protein
MSAGGKYFCIFKVENHSVSSRFGGIIKIWFYDFFLLILPTKKSIKGIQLLGSQ